MTGAAERPARVAEEKARLRRTLLSARRRRTPEELAGATRRLTGVLLAAPALACARRLAAYVALPGEPDPGPAVAAWHDAGVRVLLPVLEPDGDLDWAQYAGGAALAAGRSGTHSPAGPRLGRDAVARVDAVLVPGLAVDPQGVRLGRGGGSYDRALSRVPASVPTFVVLHAEEVLPRLPSEPHDRRVNGVVTPEGMQALGDGLTG